MSFKAYPKYKESGGEWLGQVPEHWEVMPLKRLATFTNGAAFKPTEWAESGYPIIRIENLNGGRTFNFFDGAPDPRHLVHDGDLLFGWSGNRGTSFGPFRWFSDNVCVLNQHIFKVESPCIDRNDLYWMLKAVTSHVEDQAHGIIGMVHITKGELGAIKVPVPPSDEQRGISTFVDRETAKIDALIAEQQRLIELLQEKRQAVISHAVTKGLNPDAPMKDSGIEWLGEVPENWEVKRLKNVTPSVTVGIVVEPSKYYVPEGVPALRSLNVSAKGIDLENVVFISTEANLLHSKSCLRAGDLVAVRSGQPGTCAIIPQALDGCNCVDMIIIRKPLACTEHFLRWYLLSDSAKMQFGLGAEGAIQQHFNVSTAVRLVVTVPPAAEQRLIVEAVDRATAAIDELANDAMKGIALLQERRSALISAAVTGQIDVRGFTAGGTEAA